MADEKKVLVAGATGYLGRYVVQEFKRRGYWVRVLARTPEKLQTEGPYMEPAIDQLCDELFVGEVTSSETLVGVCDGIDIVFSSIGITRQRDGVGFMDVDYQGNQNLLAEACQSNVSKFVFISVFMADRIADLASARELFIQELKQSGLAYGIVRPTGYFSDMSEYLKMARGGKVYVLGTGSNQINPIHGQDLAEVCVDSAETTQDHVERDVGGPLTYSYEEIGALACEILGVRKRIVHIPLGLVRLAVACMRPFSSRGYQAARFFTTVMSNDFVAPKAGVHRLDRYFEEMSRPG
ncbi:MAG: SDR family oxidoreductase [Desulfofustis sp.]|nr:SDR family oxidoreductase [Desulfofustis sp.]